MCDEAGKSDQRVRKAVARQWLQVAMFAFICVDGVSMSYNIMDLDMPRLHDAFKIPHSTVACSVEARNTTTSEVRFGQCDILAS